jgi:death-on-curing protein
MIFLNKIHAVQIHHRAIELFGGIQGFLNEAALESALIAAKNRAWYEGADVAACAAAYAFHVTTAHAFIDGNKRVGAGVTEAFLLVNGAALNATDDELYEIFMGIADGHLSGPQVERWFRERIVLADGER